MPTRLSAFRQIQGAIRERDFAVGISFLEVLAQNPIPPPNKNGVVLWAPENLVRLARRAVQSDQDRIFLLRVMRAFVSPATVADEASPNRVTAQHVGTLISNINLLVESGRLRVIEDADARLEALLEEVFPRSLFGIALSPEQNFVARYVGAVFTWAKRTGKAILEGGERVINEVGSLITSLRIPERTTEIRNQKKAWSGDLLATIGISENKKWFVVIAIAAASPFIPAAAPLATAFGVIGFWLAFTDP